MSIVRTRFAPSPTGFMHLGGLRTALYAFLYAKANGGDFVLRIEDTDQQRFVEGAVELIYSSLLESGLKYDEGPDIGGNYGPYVQSERKEIYAEYAKKLIDLGGAYYCFCSKERLESFASGEIDSIPELEEKVLPPEIRSTFWTRSASVNNIGI